MDVTLAGGIGVVASLIGLAFAIYQGNFVLSQPAGNETMQRIAKAIQRGAQAFLRREYTAVTVFVIVVAIILFILSNVAGSGISSWTALAFLLGALASGIAGYVGMYIAVRANVRTTQAASESLNKGLRVAFSGGTVMGTTVVSLALLGVSVLFVLFLNQLGDAATAASALAGFGFGGTSIAIFARVGGGIYTKAADVGADLVGKTEAGIPEDDPRNPATIADNVGDNVGDVAGMGSDLFESYASSIIAAISLATLGAGVASDSVSAQIFPLLVAASGVIIGILATFLVQTQEGATQEMLLGSLRRGTYSASVAVAVVVVLLTMLLELPFEIAIATISGLAGGVAIGYFTEYFTAASYGPTKALSQSAEGGAGIVIIRGLALGMMSTLAPVIIVVLVTLIATWATGLYGVAVAAVGMLATLGITLATDAYGPVADNAGGIAEMSDLPDEVRDRTDALDSLGNTTAATGKGFAIGSAAMTALALSAAFITALGLDAGGEAVVISEILLSPTLITGLFIGALLPYIFSALTMVAVGNAAQDIVMEVRRQFKEIPGIMEGKNDPDYETCVAISTNSAIRQMLLPGIIAVAVPVVLAILTVVGRGNALSHFVDEYTLVGVLMGSLVSAFMLAVMMANAGGAWDNAKKYIESGQFGGKGSDAHKAAVVGDTVGDPFKDTSGPSLNILLKLLAIVSLVIAPMIANPTAAAPLDTTTDTAIEQTIDETATVEEEVVATDTAEEVTEEVTEEAAEDEAAAEATEDADVDVTPEATEEG
ncbi:sodium-translocating pyrophosphatase [Phototrophicus methaneseepsis]|uniref:Putative K(+)-stimulated pyrophosphate-energized sodium pump n=1 Tax=Phototrophicus methaneseepsis TaxID=2710758 RepID=A0A7S8IDC2_9CHLR|nr:sodium-translocating pyrophosphatase [Phototrophicus methaneseepsis]QPC81417.1 sodium-translocating pyrophosphatase [Phototrophicus methaneseepsis]